jgi:uncharacterized protein
MKYIFLIVALATGVASAQEKKSHFKVIGFYTAAHDQAHISFVHEANKWFVDQGREHNFTYDSTADWRNLNVQFLALYDVVLFLDTRPEEVEQRRQFEEYMTNGGAWLGFHFAAFALTPSTYNQDWDWYHNNFLGSGQFKSNTWRPTSAILKVEGKHDVTKGLPPTFKAAPNEWYQWENDLRKNPSIQILCSIDTSSFPLGTGPKQHEIWREGYYPVVWTNTRYRMVYMNMGHNDIDYEGGTNRTLSSSFSSPDQNRLIIQSLFWLSEKRKSHKKSKL